MRRIDGTKAFKVRRCEVEVQAEVDPFIGLGFCRICRLQICGRLFESGPETIMEGRRTPNYDEVRAMINIVISIPHKTAY